MKHERLLKQIAFIKLIDKLKYIQRKTRLFESKRHENDAEHSWHLAIMAMVLAEHSNVQVDLMKVLKMVLIHGIVEIDAGDTFLYDNVKNHINSQEERIAAKRIFGSLPKDQAEEFMCLWEEFEEGESDEARFAKALDRFQPVLQNLSNRGGTWTEFNIRLSMIFEKTSVINKGSSILWEYAEPAIKECVKQTNPTASGEPL